MRAVTSTSTETGRAPVVHRLSRGRLSHLRTRVLALLLVVSLYRQSPFTCHRFLSKLCQSCSHTTIAPFSASEFALGTQIKSTRLNLVPSLALNSFQFVATDLFQLSSLPPRGAPDSSKGSLTPERAHVSKRSATLPLVPFAC